MLYAVNSILYCGDFLPFLCLDIIPRHYSNSHKFNQLLPQLQKFSATSPIYSTNHPPKPKLRRPLHRAEHGKAQRVNNRGLSVAKPPDRMPLLQIRLQRREPQPRQPMERRLSSLRQRFTASALWTEGLPALTSCEAPYGRGGIASLNLRTEKKCPRGTSSRTLSICDDNLLQTYFVIFLNHCKQCPGEKNQHYHKDSDNSPMK